MDAKREQALVGLFVLVASGLLITVVLLLSGWLTSGDVPFRAYFKNAGGLEPGFEVHYAGGPPIGRVTKVQNDPQDPTRMEIDFAVHPSVPVKTDSKAAITSNSPLGDNFLEIEPGSPSSPRAQSGSTLRVEGLHEPRRDQGHDRRARAKSQRAHRQPERPRCLAEGNARSRERSSRRAESRQHFGQPGQPEWNAPGRSPGDSFDARLTWMMRPPSSAR